MVGVVLDSIVSALDFWPWDSLREKWEIDLDQDQDQELVSYHNLQGEKHVSVRWIWNRYNQNIITFIMTSFSKVFNTFSASLVQFAFQRTLKCSEKEISQCQSVYNGLIQVTEHDKMLLSNAWIKMFSQRSIPSLGIKSIIVSMLQKQLGQPSTYIGRIIPLGSSVVHPTIYSQG